MLSIIVPVYNAAAHLRQCVDSVIAQSSADWELILIDDGSRDESPAICDTYAASDARIRVVHQANQGVSVARNAGIDAARGEIISFVDSDDFVESSYVATLLSEMKGRDLLYFGNKCLDADGHVELHLPLESSCNQRAEAEANILALKQDASFEFFGYTWNKCFRSRILKEHGVRFLPGLSFREDDLFTSAYFAHVHSLRVLSLPLYVYRLSSSGLTSSANKAQFVALFARELDVLSSSLNNQQLVAFEQHRVGTMLFEAALRDISLADEFSRYVVGHPLVAWRRLMWLFAACPSPLRLVAFRCYSWARTLKSFFSF